MNKGESTKAKAIRNKIMSYLAKNKGAYYSNIQNHINMGTTTAYHLNKLIKFGAVFKDGDIFKIKPSEGSYRYLEVKGNKGQVIERISITGLVSLQVDNKIAKITPKLPPSYYIEEVSYRFRNEAKYFSENL